MTLTPLSIGHGAGLVRLFCLSAVFSVVTACSQSSPEGDVGAAGDEIAQALVISNGLVAQANWNAASATLSVSGNVATGSLVSIKNQKTKEVLGQVTSVNGAWAMVLPGANMATAPCQVQATTPAYYQIKSVTGAPSNCDLAGSAPSNLAPNGVISSPAADVTIRVGGTVAFAGTGTDPDGNTPLAYAWNFSGESANSTAQNPGSITFTTAGSYVVTLTVADSRGLVDPTPAQRIVTVLPPLGTPNSPPDSVMLSPAGNMTITEGGSVNFQGTGSDPNGNIPLSYVWTFDGGAANSTQQSPGNVTFSTARTYVVRFTATDSLGLADPTPATRTITVNAKGNVNTPPNGLITSPAGNVAVAVGGSVNFAGLGSDAEGNLPLTYRWTFAGVAPNSAVQSPGSIKFSRAGTYVIALRVTDSTGLADPTPAQVTVTVGGVSNQAPNGSITSPAQNVSITAGGSVNFASIGTDPDGNTPLAYNWNFSNGAPASTIQNPGNVTFSTAGTYVVTLTARDSLGLGDPSPAQVTVTVTSTNQAPNGSITSPAQNIAVAAGSAVNFAGTGSDPNGNTPLTYLWNFGAAAPASGLQNPGNVTFTTAGTYVVSLTVRDSLGLADATPAQVTVTVTSTNQAPNGSITSPAQNIAVAAGSAVNFAGTGSDPNGNTPLTYLWNFGAAAPASSLQNPGNVTFATAGTYAVSLTVRDSLGLADPTPAQVAVIVTLVSGNRAPDSFIVSPASDLIVNVNDPVLFSGLGIDPDGNTGLTYSWNFAGGAANSTGQNPGAVVFTKAGTYQVKLTVADNFGLADATPAVRTITVRQPGTVNSPPTGIIVSPAQDMTIVAGSQVVFSSIGFDQDNNVPLSYVWNFDGAAPNAAAQNPGAITFTQAGVYTVQLVVTDALGTADPSADIRTITVTGGTNQSPNGNIVSPATDMTVHVGNSLNFSANGTDPDGDTPLTYEWNFDGAVPNKTVQNPGTVTFQRVGVYTVSLSVRDSLGMKDPTPSVRTITVDNPFVTNQAPNSAIIAPTTNITINAGDVVNFRGAAADPDGDTALSYAWALGVAGVSTALNPGDVTFPTAGDYAVTFTATDSNGLKDPTPAVRLVTVLAQTISTGAPNAVINSPSTNVTINVGSAIIFNGSAIDPNNNIPLRFAWDFDGAVPNTIAQSPGSTVFTKAGTYIVRLSVVNSVGLADPSPDVRVITVVDPNAPIGNVAPNGIIASPMMDMTVIVGDTLLFTGIGFDPDGNGGVTYRWTFDGAAPNSIQQTPGNVTFDRVGTYVVRMSVTDAHGLTDPTPDMRVIVVRSRASSNLPPAATITSPVANTTIAVGGSVFFTASGTDPDGNLPLRFIWNLDGAAPNFIGPSPGDVVFSRAGVYNVAVTVVDAQGLADPSPAIRTITVTDVNPSANLAPKSQIQSPGQDVTINVGGQVYFSGTGSDPDFNIPLSFSWDFAGGASNTLTQSPGYVVFNKAGTYRVKLNVTDSKGLADPLPDVRVITVVAGNAPGNSPPAGQILEPAGNITVDTTTLMHFIGYGSDPDMDIPLTFIWDFGGAIPNMEGQYGHNVVFPKAGTYTVRLLVADSRGMADPTPATVVVTVKAPSGNNNQPPNGTIVTPASAITINFGSSVNFSGSGSDSDGNTPLSYLWNFGGGAPNVGIQNPGNVTFSTPGIYRVTFTVADGLGLADPTPAEVIVSVTGVVVDIFPPIGVITSPVADVPGTGVVTIAVGTSLNFMGTGASPQGSVPLSYLWNMGGMAPNTIAQNPGSVKFSKLGTYKITLTVTDSNGTKDPTPEVMTVIVK